MNIKRALIAGTAVWILIFFEVSFLMFGFNVKGGLIYGILHSVFITIFIALGALYYFGDEKVKTGWKEGLKLGLLCLLISLVLDSLITVMLFVKDWNFFTSPEIILSYAWGIILSTLVGIYRKSNPVKKQRMKRKRN